MKTDSRRSIVFIGLFVLAVLAAGILNALLHTDLESSVLEFRTLARAPGLSLRSYIDGSFAAQSDRFLADQFFARPAALEAGRRFEAMLGFGGMVTRSGAQARIAPHRAAGGCEPSMQDGGHMVVYYHFPQPENYCFRSFPVLPDRARAYARAVDELAASDPERTVYNLVVPSSAAFVPEDWRGLTGDPAEQCRRIAAQYRESGRVIPVDVTEALGSLDVTEAFFRTDHHWNGPGIYAAYVEFCRAAGFDPLPPRDPIVVPGFLGSYYRMTRRASLAADPDVIVAYRPHSEVVLRRYVLETQTPGADSPADPAASRVVALDPTQSAVSLELMGDTPSYGIYLGGDYGLSVIEPAAGADRTRRILVFKDSMGNGLAPLLADHYAEVHVVDPRHWRPGLSAYMRDHGIDEVLIINGDTAPVYGRFTEQIRCFWED